MQRTKERRRYDNVKTKIAFFGILMSFSYLRRSMVQCSELRDIAETRSSNPRAFRQGDLDNFMCTECDSIEAVSLTVFVDS